MRESAGSFRTAANGAYMHPSRMRADDAKKPISRPERISQLTRVSDQHLDVVYRALLEALSLSEAHTQDLKNRGLNERAIQSDHYRSAPTCEQMTAVMNKIQQFGLTGVPGFYKRDGEWFASAFAGGILIPVRNLAKQVCGIQIRLDKAASGSRYVWFSSSKHPSGTSSGAPLHWSNPELLTTKNEVLITEGALKANVISHFLNVTVVAAAGVRSFGSDFSHQLKSAHPKVTAIICFDSDWRTKEPVHQGLKTVCRQLSAEGVRWQVRSWTAEYKGYDDYLAHHFGK